MTSDPKAPRARTLRRRLVWMTATTTALILLMAGAVTYALVRAWAVDEFDRALESTARAVAALTEQDSAGVKLEPEADAMPEFSRGRTRDVFMLWGADGAVIARSKSLGQREFARPAVATEAGLIESTTLPDGDAGRSLTISFFPAFEEAGVHAPNGTRQVTLTVARHTKPLEQKLTRLGWILGISGLAAALVAAGVMAAVVRSGFRPLAALAGRIAAVGRTDLAERVEVDGAPAELGVVIARLNELLDHVQTTIGRERRFTADVAHELRTPLAGLATTLEVCLARPRAAAEYQRAAERCAAIVSAMHAMVENLMTLARADSRQIPVAVAPVCVAQIVGEAWREHEARAAGKGMSASFKIDLAPHAIADASMLRIVINNLLDNAVRHGDEGGWMRALARRDGRELTLTVSNSGCRIKREDAEKVFDRFWRGDAARTGTGEHAGLGLSLCREIVQLQGGRIEASVEVGGVFAICVTLPAATDSAADVAARSAVVIGEEARA